MIKNLENITVKEKTKIKDVLLKIELNGINGVFVLSNKKNLIGVITDSDIRKSILKNNFTSKLKAKDLVKKQYLSIPFSKRSQKKKILIQSNKILIPIVKGKKLIDYVHTSELVKSKITNFKRVLVIGGLGYIGSTLVPMLLKKKLKVNILDKNYYGNHLSQKIIKDPNLKIIKGDCLNKAKLNEALEGCSDVIHLGEIVGDPAVKINHNFSIKNNFEATVFVLSECIKNKIDKFIFASSCSVYGETPRRCTEKSELNPLSLYAKCKIECEKTISSFKSKDFCPVILRLATVYGDSPRKRFDLVVNRFTVMAIQKIKIKLFGANSWRPFISVQDVSRAILTVLNSKNSKVKNKIFNVGSDKENYRIKDIIKELNKYIKINYQTVNQKDDERNYKVSFKKINRILNFKIKFNFKSSIKRLVKKYQKEKINIRNFNYYNDKKILNILKQKKLF